MIEEIRTCYRCRDMLRDGDEYYDVGGTALCPDCFDAWAESIKRFVGDVFDKAR